MNPKVVVNEHIQHIYDMNYLCGFCSAAIVYYVLNLVFSAHEPLLESPVYDDIIVQDGVEIVNDGVQLSSDMKLKNHPEIDIVSDLPSP